MITSDDFATCTNKTCLLCNENTFNQYLVLVVAAILHLMQIPFIVQVLFYFAKPSRIIKNVSRDANIPVGMFAYVMYVMYVSMYQGCARLIFFGLTRL